MSKKRKRKKKPSADTNDQEYGLARGEKYVDLDIIKLCKRFGIPVRRSLFVEAGFRCVICGYATKKTGTRGRNTMRSHHKAHLNEARAGRRLETLFLLGSVIGVGSVLWLLIGTLDTTSFETWLNGIESSTLMGAGYTSACLVMSTVLLYFADVYSKRYRRKLRMAFYLSLIPAGGLALLPAAYASKLVTFAVNPLWFIPCLLPIVSLGMVSKSIGLTNLKVRRRQIPPANYIPMLKALTEEGDDLVDTISSKFRAMIRRGSMDASKLEHWEKLALVMLGVIALEKRV